MKVTPPSEKYMIISPYIQEHNDAGDFIIIFHLIQTTSSRKSLQKTMLNRK